MPHCFNVGDLSKPPTNMCLFENRADIIQAEFDCTISSNICLSNGAQLDVAIADLSTVRISLTKFLTHMSKVYFETGMAGGELIEATIKKKIVCQIFVINYLIMFHF